MKKDAIPAIRSGATAGDGRFSKPTHPTSRSQPATKKIAWDATSRQRQQTGFTSTDIQFLPLSSNTMWLKLFSKQSKEIFDEEVSVSNRRRSRLGQCEFLPARCQTRC